jgi:hypothetical protein
MGTAGVFNYTFPGGKTKTTSDTAANDSDKIIAVPTGKKWLIKSILIEFVATATVGNRVIAVRIQDAAHDVQYETRSDTITASNWLFIEAIPGCNYGTLSNMRCIPLPNPCVLVAGEEIAVKDDNAIDAAADDMVIHIRHQEVPHK